MNNENNYNTQHSITFSEVTWTERLKQITRHIPNQLPLFATVTISFWGVAEVIAEIGGDRLTLKNLAIPALATAIVISFYRAIQAYLKYFPESIATESYKARKIYRNGKCGWQFDLARQMLLDRIRNIDRKLNRIEIGAEYIPPTNLPESEYLFWLENRTEILTRLIKAVAMQCTNELPKILAITTDEKKLADIKDAVEQLTKLYEETANFELENQSIKPPEKFSHVHEMTFGWSTPIRDGIRKFVSILDGISKLDVRRILSGDDQLPNFSFSFEPPPNIEEFTKALHSVEFNS